MTHSVQYTALYKLHMLDDLQQVNSSIFVSVSSSTNRSSDRTNPTRLLQDLLQCSNYKAVLSEDIIILQIVYIYIYSHTDTHTHTHTYIYVYIFGISSWHTGSQSPDQGLNLCPLHGKLGVITTRKVPSFYYSYCNYCYH